MPAIGQHTHHQIAVIKRSRAYANRDIDPFSNNINPPVRCFQQHIHQGNAA
jgi:hypothetical protein